jgi:2-oxoisovalerate dehydrogenase E1 component
VFSGFGAEISAMITEEAFQYLDAPVKRIGSPFTPVGFNRILEKAILPDIEKIYQGIKEIIEY